MRLAIIDLETNFAEPDKAEILEIACCVYSMTLRTIETVFSTLVSGATENPAQWVNGIPAEALPTARTLDRAMQAVGHFVADVDVLAAHNGDHFERPVLERHGCPWVASKPWLDTMFCEWPRQVSSRALIAIAHTHGVQIGSLHRAAHDVLLMADLFSRCAELGHDVDAMLARAMRPKKLFVADVSYDDREKAKAAGFQWEGATKRWLRKMAPEDIGNLGFTVREVAA